MERWSEWGFFGSSNWIWYKNRVTRLLLSKNGTWYLQLGVTILLVSIEPVLLMITSFNFRKCKLFTVCARNVVILAMIADVGSHISDDELPSFRGEYHS